MSVWGFLWVLWHGNGGVHPFTQQIKSPWEDMVNCKLNEILLGDVTTEIYANFQMVQRNRNDLIEYAGPLLGYYSYLCLILCHL